MSRRMAVLNVVLRRIARPMLARTATPEQGAIEFARAARLAFRAPPFVRHLDRPAGSLPLHWISAGPVRSCRVILHLHGGAYFSGSAQTHRGLLARLSRLSRVEVCAPDYRLLQDAPFPAAFDDTQAAWQALLALGYRPADIVLGGDSAGGGLALALLAQLCAQGTPPAGLYGLSPWTDLTLSGDSLRAFARSDSLLPVERMPEVAAQYLDGAAPDDPRASPLFARFNAPPPVLLQVGSAEALRDDTLRMAAHLRAAGGEVTEQVWPDAPHVWQMFDGWIPEARAALRDVAGFVQTSLDSASR